MDEHGSPTTTQLSSGQTRLLSGTGIVLGNSGSFIAMFYRLKAEHKRS